MHKTTATQCETIKAHLLEGKPITTWQAIQLYQITSLSTRISELRKGELNIKQKLVTNANGKRYNVYWLDSVYIQDYEARKVAQ